MKSNIGSTRLLAFLLALGVVLSACGGADEALIGTASQNGTGTSLESATARKWLTTLPNGRTYQAQTSQTASTSSTQPTTSSEDSTTTLAQDSTTTSSQQTATTADSSTSSASSTTIDTTSTAPASTTVVSASAPSASINSIDTIVGDMSLSNDSALDGIPDFAWATWPNPAAVVLGSDPRGCKMLSWWLNMSGVQSQYKDCDLWTAFMQWFVIFEGVGNNALNVRVEVRNPRTYYLSRSTGTWRVMGTPQSGSGWFQAAKSNLMWVPGSVDVRTNADGSVAVLVPRGSPNVYHGVWSQGRLDIASLVTDIAALVSTVQARLVIDNPTLPDDRSQANLLMQSGADYYPNMTASPNDFMPPGAGVSRTKRITNEWQSFNMATLDIARQDYTGAAASISVDALRRNPPPLD